MFHSHQIKGRIVPVQDYLILRPVREKEIRKGILLPDNVENYGHCPVVAAGPKCQLKKGDTVYIQKFVEGELKFELNGKTVYAIRERHVNVAINPKGPVKLRAVGDKILVKREADATVEEIRKGIVIPSVAQEKTQRCKVLSLGSGILNGVEKHFEVRVGTTVLIAKYGGTEVTYGDKSYTIINENDVIGTLDEPAKLYNKKSSGPVARTAKALGSPRTTA